ncbi:hypothetical protein HDV02_004132, partial [Globomyces sp. JEL0801]
KSLQHAALACDKKLVLDWVEAEDLEKDVQTKEPIKFHDARRKLVDVEDLKTALSTDCMEVPLKYMNVIVTDMKLTLSKTPPLTPSAPFLGLILAATKTLKSHLDTLDRHEVPILGRYNSLVEDP